MQSLHSVLFTLMYMTILIYTNRNNLFIDALPRVNHTDAVQIDEPENDQDGVHG